MIVTVPILIMIILTALCLSLIGLYFYYELYEDLAYRKNVFDMIGNALFGSLSLCIGFLFSVLAYNIMMSL